VRDITPDSSYTNCIMALFSSAVAADSTQTKYVVRGLLGERTRFLDWLMEVVDKLEETGVGNLVQMGTFLDATAEEVNKLVGLFRRGTSDDPTAIWQLRENLQNQLEYRVSRTRWEEIEQERVEREARQRGEGVQRTEWG
jgi:hypothetical protein